MNHSNLKPFIIGVLFSTCIFILLSFTTSWNISDQSTYPVLQVHSTTADIYKSNFSTVYPNDTKGTDVSLKQWKAMNQIVSDLNNDLTNVSGFRFYYGLNSKSASATKLAMAYVLNDGLEMPEKGSIGTNDMVTAANDLKMAYVDDCPPFCD